MDFKAADGGGVHATLAAALGDASENMLALGHQGTGGEETPTCMCPALSDDLLDEQPPPDIKLGAVAIPINSNNEVLLTRRPRHMRTFPGCWVLPGGKVDPEDQSVAHAALRELEEETGLVVSLASVEQPAPLCLWESCFPVSFDEWTAARSAGKRTNHFLITFVTIRLNGEEASQPLKLQPQECDSACWVPLSDVAEALCGEDSEECPVEFSSSSYAPAAVVKGGEKEGEPVDASLLAGVYPNRAGEGVGRGHLWALRRLLERQKVVTAMD